MIAFLATIGKRRKRAAPTQSRRKPQERNYKRPAANARTGRRTRSAAPRRKPQRVPEQRPHPNAATAWAVVKVVVVLVGLMLLSVALSLAGIR